MEGVRPIYYNITWGGSGQFITILHGGGGAGGAAETPKLYYVINEQPLTHWVIHLSFALPNLAIWV